jgi:hypothetical protein
MDVLDSKERIMSLGLKDLHKKRRHHSNPVNDSEVNSGLEATLEKKETKHKNALAQEFGKAKATPKSFGRPAFGVRPKIPASAWEKKTVTARPWTDNGLTKNGRNRKNLIDPEAAMNEDWINLFTTPWFWVECAPESRLLRLQQQLASIEEQLEQRVRDSFDALRRFIGV